MSANASDAAALLSVEGLRTWFPIKRGVLRRTVGHVQAVTDVDLSVRPGSTVALVGESGCGKTTVGRSILRLESAQAGRVLFDGQDVTQLHPADRHVAQVFQFPVVYDTMTVFDNLAFPLRNRRLGATDVDRRVRDVAAMLDLDDILQRRASGLTAA